jgi:hypothetical protein
METYGQEMGCSVTQVALRAGHDPSVAARYYSGKVAESDRALADAVASLLTAEPKRALARPGVSGRLQRDAGVQAVGGGTTRSGVIAGVVIGPRSSANAFSLPPKVSTDARMFCSWLIECQSIVQPAYGSELPRPVVDVLEDVLMDRLEVRKVVSAVERIVRQLDETGAADTVFDDHEFDGVGDAENVS